MRARLRPPLLGLSIIALGMAMTVSALAKPKWKPAPKKPPAEAAAKPEEPAAKTEEAPPKGEEPAVKAAGTSAPKEGSKDGKGGKVTTVEETGKDKGVKTYKFSAVEVEGRLKSPQIAYFLRRVRAEFEAGDLGHRSFVPELKDTRRSPSLR